MLFPPEAKDVFLFIIGLIILYTFLQAMKRHLYASSGLLQKRPAHMGQPSLLHLQIAGAKIPIIFEACSND
jgi:hypothetical protein